MGKSWDKCKWTHQRCRSSDNPSLVIVLGSMAGANELVLGGVKRHNTTKVSAHSIDSICGKSSIFLHNKVGRITLVRKQSKLHPQSHLVKNWLDTSNNSYSVAEIWILHISWSVGMILHNKVINQTRSERCISTFNPCVRVLSPGPWVLSHSAAITSFPIASLATWPPLPAPEL